MITQIYGIILPWIQMSSPILLFGVYYGFLSTLPIGPAQMYYVRAMLMQNKVVDNRKIVPTGKLILGGSFVAQLVVFSSIYLGPIYTSIWKPHVMTIMLVPVLFFLIFQTALIRKYPWLQNPAIEFLIGVALQLLNPALFGKSVYTRLTNMMIFRYSESYIFMLSTAAGWLSGQILFVKMTKIFCSRVENDTPLRVDRRRELFAFSFQIIFFAYAMLTCYGRNPSFITTKWNDSRSFIQGPREELEEVSLELSDKKKSFREDVKTPKKKKKHKYKTKVSINMKKKNKVNKPPIPLSPSYRTLVRILSLEDLKLDTATDSALGAFLIKKWPLIFFDSNRFNQPLRYVSIGDFILRGPVKSQVAEYFFDVCLFDGHQRISFTAPPSMSFFAKMANLGDQSLDLNQDNLDEWIVRKSERKSYLGEELENRVRALSNGSPIVDILEKKMRFSRTKGGKYLPEVHDPLLSGPFRGSMNQFKSPWMLHSEDYLKEKKKNKLSECKNHDSTNRLFRISLIPPENKDRIVQPRIKMISKWWIEKIHMFLLEEQNRKKWLDESTLEDLKSRYDKMFPKTLSSLEHVFKTLVPAPLNAGIEKGIASCDKKLITNYLLHIFLETTGLKWELLLSVLPAEQALLYERFFFINSKEFSNSRVSMNIKISQKNILNDFVEISEEDLPSKKTRAKDKKRTTKDKKRTNDKSNFDQDLFEKKKFDQDMKDFTNFHELYLIYNKFMEKEKIRVDDYEPRIRDFNRFIVPKLPSTLISGVHDPLAVKDCLETRPKKARQLIIIKPFDKIEELKQKKEKKKGFFQPFKEKALEQEETPEEGKGGDEEEDLVFKDIYVFSYPYEGDFRRDLVKGAVRFQRRKVSAINHWIARPESILFGRLRSMTQKPEGIKSHHKPFPKKEVKEKTKIKKTSRSLRIYEKFLERRERRKEERRRRTQQTFDGEVIHYVRAALLFTHTYLRKRLYFPILIIAKNIGRTVLFQAPEWEQDWSNLQKEAYLKCNYDGYELTDPDVPKKFIKDYIKEGIQIKIVYPFRLRPWYESNSTEIDKKTTGFLTIYGTEIELPFGNPPKVPSFWKPIGEWIWNYTSDRAKPIIEPIRQLIIIIEPIRQLINKKFQKEIKIDTRTEIRMIRTKPTSNIKFSLEVVQDEPLSIQMEKDLDLTDPNDWTTTMNDRINQMNEEYLFNLDIYNKLKTDFKQIMDQPSPDIKSRLKKEWTRIKFWRSLFQKKSIRFIKKKLPYFMKVIHFRVKLILIDLKISMFNMIESNLEFCMQLSRSIEAIQKIFNSNGPISKNAESKCQGKEISQAYVFHKIWREIRNMKGFYARDLLESRTSSPFIKKDVKEFLHSQGILDCKHPRELTANHWKQWLKWCPGYRIAPHKNKKRIIGNRLGWSEFASFLGEKRFASFLTRLKNRIKRHRYDLLAYSYLDHMKEDNHGPAIQYIPEPDYKAITNFQNPGSCKKKKNSSFFSFKKKKNNCDSSKKKNVDFFSATKEKYYKKSRYYKWQFWLFPDLRKRIKKADKLGDVFPPDIIRRQIEQMWEFREIQVPKDFDVDAFVIESLRKKEEERRSKVAALEEIREARRKRKEERLKTREERRKKFASATSPEEVNRLRRAFKVEDDQSKRTRMKESKKRFFKQQRARQLAKIAAQKAEQLRKEERRRKLEELRRKKKYSNKRKKDFLVRDFYNIYYPKKNIDKINIEKEEVRIAIKEIILKQDAKKASQGDKKAWDRVKSKLDEKNKKVQVPSETKTKPKKANKQEIQDPKTEYLKEQKRFRREAKRLAREAELKEEMKLRGLDPKELEKEKLAYREMAKNIRRWRTKFELEKLPLAPWASKFKNASRFFDKKKLGNETAVADLLFPYAENGDLDLELLETVLYLKSCFPKENDLLRVFAEATRRSMPFVPGYFNDRFFVYKIASLFLKLKKKKIDVNLFDRSQRRRKIHPIEDVNEKISSSFIFEDVFLPRRRRELRILNLLNLENHSDESVRFNSKEIPNDQGLMKKNEYLIVDTRQKIRRFLWPRYRLEDLICMNRFWWNTNNGSRSVMLRIRMYPKIDHWEHIQNNLYFIRHSFISIREILQNFGNHTKSFLGTKHSPVAGRNEAINEVKLKKEDSFCSISSSLPSDRSPYNELLTLLRKIISLLRDSWIGSLFSKLRDFFLKSMRELFSKLRDFLIKRMSSLRDFFLKSMRELFSKLRDFLIKRMSSLRDFFLKSMRELFSKLRLELQKVVNSLKKKLRKLIDPLKLETKLFHFRSFLRNLINEIRVKLINFLSFLRNIIDGLLVKLKRPRPLSRWQKTWNFIQKYSVPITFFFDLLNECLSFFIR
uniref:Protein TIC 214 n=1 Tax=Chamaecyparis formosensis TaxID=187461 RepID=A0A7R6UKZ5_CHAFM|nr:hypothetical protein RF1 [Chamaecyparis formosensis]BCB63477.1 hypothetical protein RF1 [Chamaecyparis formosensis]BCB63726.1 hypothetical protein RF1 [Chamaecyparis formosensis]